MVGKTTATAAEKRRLALIKEHMPCIPCLLTLNRTRLPTVQHVTSGFTREGHHKTYASCDWHHLGVKANGWSRQAMSGLLGPSLTMGKRTFQDEYGHEHVLVAVQDQLIKEFAEHPWLDYDISTDCRRRVTDLWISMK